MDAENQGVFKISWLDLDYLKVVRKCVGQDNGFVNSLDAKNQFHSSFLSFL